MAEDDHLLLKKILLNRKVRSQNIQENSCTEIIEPLGKSIGWRYLLFVKTYFIEGEKWKDLIYFDRVTSTQHIFPSNNPKSYSKKKQKYNTKFKIIETFSPRSFFFQNNVLVHDRLPFELQYKIVSQNKLLMIRLFVTGGGYRYWGGKFMVNKISKHSPRISMVYDCLSSLAMIVEYPFLKNNSLKIEKNIFFLSTDIVNSDQYKLSKKNNYLLSKKQQEIVYQKKYTYREIYLKQQLFYLNGRVDTEYLTNY